MYPRCKCDHFTLFICFTKPLALLVVPFSFETKPTFARNACADQGLVSAVYQMRDTFHTRSDTNVERFSLWENPNKSYACVLASLARYKGTAAVTGCFLELHLTWFKKYHLLSPNYTTISFFVPIRDRSVNTRSRNSPD